MDDKLIFEKADEHDIPALTDLRIKYLLEDYGTISEDKLSRISDELPDYFYRHLGKDLLAFVCRDSGRIAGCCLLLITEKPQNPSFINGKTGSVMNVYTLPEYRKKGIAHELMKMLLAESERTGLDLVELKATDAGHSLYLSLGFEDIISKYHNMKFVFDEQKKG